MNWREALQARLLALQPASVLALDESARLVAGSVLPATPVHTQGKLPGTRCALALGIDALNGLNAKQAMQLISQTRLYTAPRILLAVESNCVLDPDVFRALGFMLSTPNETDGKRFYYYDLDTYKNVPDWLNARYWAHPERWEP